MSRAHSRSPRSAHLGSIAGFEFAIASIQGHHADSNLEPAHDYVHRTENLEEALTASGGQKLDSVVVTSSESGESCIGPEETPCLSRKAPLEAERICNGASAHRVRRKAFQLLEEQILPKVCRQYRVPNTTSTSAARYECGGTFRLAFTEKSSSSTIPGRYDVSMMNKGSLDSMPGRNLTIGNYEKQAPLF
jgi:hypothetical protein